AVSLVALADLATAQGDFQTARESAEAAKARATAMGWERAARPAPQERRGRRPGVRDVAERGCGASAHPLRGRRSGLHPRGGVSALGDALDRRRCQLDGP